LGIRSGDRPKGGGTQTAGTRGRGRRNRRTKGKGPPGRTGRVEGFSLPEIQGRGIVLIPPRFFRLRGTGNQPAFRDQNLPAAGGPGEFKGSGGQGGHRGGGGGGKERARFCLLCGRRGWVTFWGGPEKGRGGGGGENWRGRQRAPGTAVEKQTGGAGGGVLRTGGGKRGQKSSEGSQGPRGPPPPSRGKPPRAPAFGGKPGGERFPGGPGNRGGAVRGKHHGGPKVGGPSGGKTSRRGAKTRRAWGRVRAKGGIGGWKKEPGVAFKGGKKGPGFRREKGQNGFSEGGPARAGMFFSRGEGGGRGPGSPAGTGSGGSWGERGGGGGWGGPGSKKRAHHRRGTGPRAPPVGGGGNQGPREGSPGAGLARGGARAGCWDGAGRMEIFFRFCPPKARGGGPLLGGVGTVNRKKPPSGGNNPRAGGKQKSRGGTGTGVGVRGFCSLRAPGGGGGTKGANQSPGGRGGRGDPGGGGGGSRRGGRAGQEEGHTDNRNGKRNDEGGRSETQTQAKDGSGPRGITPTHAAGSEKIPGVPRGGSGGVRPPRANGALRRASFGFSHGQGARQQQLFSPSGEGKGGHFGFGSCFGDERGGGGGGDRRPTPAEVRGQHPCAFLWPPETLSRGCRGFGEGSLIPLVLSTFIHCLPPSAPTSFLTEP